MQGRTKSCKEGWGKGHPLPSPPPKWSPGHMLSNDGLCLYMRHVQCVLPFLVLVVNSDRFQILRSYTLLLRHALMHSCSVWWPKCIVAIVTKLIYFWRWLWKYITVHLYGQCMYSSLLFHLLLQCLHHQPVTLQSKGDNPIQLIRLLPWQQSVHVTTWNTAVTTSKHMWDHLFTYTIKRRNNK